MADIAERQYGMVKITVEADPMLGVFPAWANVVEIAEEAILIVKRRNEEEKQAQAEHEAKLDE